ncbi:MAG: LysR family transcriptional regulator [Candidatus Eisenbacteria bacterium]|nr:LysR family transcriptional regulator [Candidatus Eisenbacteria bacterium]
MGTGEAMHAGADPAGGRGPEVEIEKLRAFVTAVRLGSVSAAARELGRSQPAISAKLQGLERAVGEGLLMRGARGVRPTRRGGQLYARAQELLRGVDELVADWSDPEGRGQGKLEIGATDVMAVFLLPPILQRMRRRHPGTEIEVTVEGSRPLCTRLRRGDLDLALVTLPAEEPELTGREIHREPLVVVAAPNHRLARRRRVSLEELASEPMIAHRRESITREMVAASFRVAGLEPRVAMEVSSPEAMKQLVALGLGIAPLSRALVADELAERRLVRLRAPEFRCLRRSGVVRRADQAPRPLVNRFLALLPRPADRRAVRRPARP